MTEPFTQPPEPPRVRAADLRGRLLLIWPAAIETARPTVHGPTDAVRCRIAELDGPTPGTVHDDVLLFGTLVVGQLRTALAEGQSTVLARMGQGEARPGQSPPWKLEPYTDADRQTALTFLSTHPQTAPPPPPPAAAPPASPPVPRPFGAPAPGQGEHPY
ncbi:MULTISPECIES: hypothetical protein [unclassified Nocardiopsis]|uniref:hypothetical protein n=1 Tax=unclassified Nocardiopsis TaxID=2649073 RepID=UPI00135756AF|nr:MULTISPECIES: hypothetical protein [unclassified Nocardiopsis]